MNDGDEPGRGSPSTAAFPGRHLLPPISLPLHEAVGLALLFERAPDELVCSLAYDGASYSRSAAYGFLHIREAIARLFADTETLEAISAERARLDQISV